MDNNTTFRGFLSDCLGQWRSQRTYHYLTYQEQEVERSRTDFTIGLLDESRKIQLLADSNYGEVAELDRLLGFSLGFYTISEKGEEVSQDLSLMFVPKSQKNSLLEGDYLRDRAYEEARPIISHFRFDFLTKELLMTTNYTYVVSIDSITLVSPQLRIRKILNYQKHSTEQPLKDVSLVGFGVEQKMI